MPESRLPFTDWLARQDLDVNLIGDLARDVKRDQCLPLPASAAEVFEHVQKIHHGTDWTLDAVIQAEQAWLCSGSGRTREGELYRLGTTGTWT